MDISHWTLRLGGWGRGPEHVESVDWDPERETPPAYSPPHPDTQQCETDCRDNCLRAIAALGFCHFS